MGETWEKNGTKYPSSTIPFPRFFQRSNTFPYVKYSIPMSGPKMGKESGGILQTGYFLGLVSCTNHIFHGLGTGKTGGVHAQFGCFVPRTSQAS